MTNPVDNPELYDSIVVGGKRSPGVVTLSGHDRKIGWDVKKGPGQSGATTTRTSEDPAEVTCKFYLADDEEFTAWDSFEQVLKSTVSGANPQALDIYHPDLVSRDIKSIVLKTLGGVVHDGMGGQTISVVLLEYRPAKAKGGTPSGSQTKSKTDKAAQKDDPNAAALAELAALTEEYKRTPWG